MKEPNLQGVLVEVFCEVIKAEVLLINNYFIDIPFSSLEVHVKYVWYVWMAEPFEKVYPG